ncbi:MAG: response regulator receiver protein [Pseudolabrys sp.]|nr:response regulator receiver protein [Pseudolabrys sp.]
MSFKTLQNAPKDLHMAVLTPDREFAKAVHETFGAHPQIALELIAGTAAEPAALAGRDVVIVDIDAASGNELASLQRLLLNAQTLPPILVVIREFDESVARALLQMRVTDFMVKPVAPIELVRACSRATQKDNVQDGAEAKTYTFLPASGGVGVTTLAIQTAMLLLNSRGGRARPSACLVDLDFQHGAVADYLDLEPRLNLNEIEPRPDRLDRQLLEVMLSYHASGLTVVAAPNRPAEMRSFDPDVVTRLLDLVSGHFEYVVFDMPRTWFSWTDNVLLGSDHLYVVSESTVPGLRHARNLVGAMKERFAERVNPRVVVNRFQYAMFSPALRRADLEQTLGNAFAAAIPNDYALVREAIDRGVPLQDVKPGNKITLEMRKLVLPQAGPKRAAKSSPLLARLGLAPAR